MVKQYPYSLWVQTFLGNAIADNNGNFAATASVWEQLSPARDEVNSGGAQVILADGTTSVFDALIQLPLYCPEVADGTAFQVRDGATVRVKGTAKRFVRGQLHCRLWV